MPLTRGDRADMNSMHAVSNGIGSSGQDSSRKRAREVSESNGNHWKNDTPTPIPMPTNSGRSSNTKPAKSSGANPYSRVSNNLYGSAHKPSLRDASGSRTNPSTRTVVPRDAQFHYQHPVSPLERSRPPPAKKAKLNNPVVKRLDTVYGADTSSRDPQRSEGDGTRPSITAQASQELDIIFAPSPSLSEKGGKQAAKRAELAQDHFPVFPMRSKRQEVIDVDQEEEDLGESVELSTSVLLSHSDSSDEMQLRPRADTRNGSRPRDPSPSVQEILGVSEPPPQHPFNQKENYDFLPPPSGPHTSALKAQLDGRGAVSPREATIIDESDPIQDPDGFGDELQRVSAPAPRSKRNSTPSGTTEFTDNHVRETAKLYDKPVDRPPEVDLIAKNAQNPAGPTKVSIMKRKGRKGKAVEALISGPKPANAHNLGKPPPAERRNPSRPDAIATSSSGFRSEGKGRGSEKEFILPIEILALGTRIVESLTSDDPQPRYWLRVREKYISVLRAPIEKEDSVFEYELGHDVNGVELPQSASVAKEFPLVVFTLRVTDRTKDLIEKTERLDPPTKVSIGVKLMTSHANWRMTTYKGLETLLKAGKAGKCYLTAPAIRARWQTFLRPDISSESPAASRTSQTTRRQPKPRPTYAGAIDSSKATDQESSSSSSRVPQGVRRSARQSAGSREYDRSPSPPADEIILLYPPTGTGAVNVTNGDLKRLEPGEYLNDNLIEFGLKLWLNNLRAARPEFADQVHVFSSFFYTQLNQKNLEEGYQSVRKWTSKFDLFKKKYIVVPINEHLHWYLAIICHPERALQEPAPTQAVTPNVTTRTKFQESLSGTSPQNYRNPRERSTSTRPPSSKHAPASAKPEVMDEQQVEDIVHISHSAREDTLRPASPPSTTTLSPGSDREDVIPMTESEGEDDVGPPDVSMKVDSVALGQAPVKSGELDAIPPKAFYAASGLVDAKVCTNPLLADQEDEVDELGSDDPMDVDISALESTKPDEPYIFSFDSLGARHPHALKVLSRYLDMEAKDKKRLNETVPAVTKKASVPAQPNYCDCGVYLLHFVQEFMSDPDTFSRHITDHNRLKKATESNKLDRERLWRHDAVASIRENLKQELVSLSSEWRREKEAEGKGKGKENGKVEAERSRTPAKSIMMDHDSDIEVLEVSPEPSKPVKCTRPRASVAPQKAARIR